ncbi:hypothetical protein [Aliiglaciecola aliphaticivorans]
MDIQINQVLRRYQLSESQRHYKMRLDALTEQLFREYLDLALARHGYTQKDILCIRNWYLPMEFDHRKTDIDIFQDWLNELEASLQTLLTTANPNRWLHYPSEVEALKSVARELAVGQLGNTWAWQQMGVISHSKVSLEDAKAAWLAYLIRQPWLLKGVVIGLAVEARLDLLFEHKFIAFKDSIALMDVLLEFVPNWTAIVDDINHQYAGNLTELMASVQPYLTSQNTPQGSEITGLPQWFKYFLKIKGNWSRTYADFNQRGNQQASQIAKWQANDVKSMVFIRFLFACSVNGHAHNIVNNQGLKTYVCELVEELTQLAQMFSDSAIGLGSEPKNLQTSTLQDVHHLNQPKQLTSLSILPEENEDLLSEYAGLLFVLNILKQPEWQHDLAILLDNPYPVIEQLNLLGQYLLPQGMLDPVIKVFSGELFAAQSTKAVSKQIKNADYSAYQSFAKQIKLALMNHLGEPPNSNGNMTFEFLCRRKGRIEYQAGWVNIVFEMDTIDTQIRGAGLDLNPDYVPWLGYVVKFYYE